MTVHSNDRASWLTKLERIGELSTENKSLVFNNIGHLINVGMLKEQYWQLNGKKAVGIDKVTFQKQEKSYRCSERTENVWRHGFIGSRLR